MIEVTFEQVKEFVSLFVDNSVDITPHTYLCADLNMTQKELKNFIKEFSDKFNIKRYNTYLFRKYAAVKIHIIALVLSVIVPGFVIVMRAAYFYLVLFMPLLFIIFFKRHLTSRL